MIQWTGEGVQNQMVTGRYPVPAFLEGWFGTKLSGKRFHEAEMKLIPTPQKNKETRLNITRILACKL